MSIPETKEYVEMCILFAKTDKKTLFWSDVVDKTCLKNSCTQARIQLIIKNILFCFRPMVELHEFIFIRV